MKRLFTRSKPVATEVRYASMQHASPEQQWRAMLDGIEDKDPRLEHDGKAVRLHRFLGAGGTKWVFDASLEGERVALGLPNPGNNVQDSMRSWDAVRKEPANTARMRDLGLAVNTRAEMVPVTVNGMPFDAITFNRYQDLPWGVRDSKNSHSSIGSSRIFGRRMDAVQAADALQGVTNDIRTMLDGGVRLGIFGCDSFNLRQDADGTTGLFLNDLVDVEFEPFSTNEYRQTAARYVRLGMTMLVAGLDRREYGYIKPAMELDGSDPDSLMYQLRERVLA